MKSPFSRNENKAFARTSVPGRVYFSKQAEQRFFFICTLVMLGAGLIFRFL